MKIKSTVWIACIVIPLALVVLLLRFRVERTAVAEEAAQAAKQREAAVAPADQPTVESAVPKEGVTDAPKAGSDEFSIPETAEPEPAKPTTDPGDAKPNDNAPAATDCPIGPIKKANVRLVPFQSLRTEVRFTEAYRLKNQNAARIAAELKKMVPELEITHDAATESVIIQEMTPKMREFVTEVVQRLSAARQEPLTPQPDIASGMVEAPLAARSGAKKRTLPTGTAEQRIPDLTGNWTGEGWGRVELRQTEPGVFRGSYSDTYGQKSGSLALRWSAEERRFNGEWTEGDQDRLGELTARLTDAGNVILGAFSADAKSKINPGQPKLGDLQWTRVVPGVPNVGPPMGPQPLSITNWYPEPGEGRGYSTAVGNGLRVFNRDRNVVKDEVRRAFEARQESLRKELAEFRDRIDRLAVTLHERDRQQDAIIERRVDELLNPNLRWDAASNTPSGPGLPPMGSNERHYPLVGIGSLVDGKLMPSARANDFRVGDSAFSVGTIDKGLEFLSQYPRFSGLSLAMTEGQFRAFLEQQKLVPQLSIPREGQLNYSIPLGDGIRLTVMFGLDGKCRGIEPIGDSAPSPILPQSAPPVPVHAEKVVAKIVRLEQADAASVAKALQELAREKPFSARISADVTSNSVIVFANPDDMPVIEAIVIRLDKAPDSPSPKAAPKFGDGSSPTDETSGTSNTAKPASTQLASELKLWQGRWLLVSAEINGEEQKRDEVSTQSITVSGKALKIASRHPEPKAHVSQDGLLKPQ